MVYGEFAGINLESSEQNASRSQVSPHKQLRQTDGRTVKQS